MWEGHFVESDLFEVMIEGEYEAGRVSKLKHIHMSDLGAVEHEFYQCRARLEERTDGADSHVDVKNDDAECEPMIVSEYLRKDGHVITILIWVGGVCLGGETDSCDGLPDVRDQLAFRTSVATVDRLQGGGKA